MNLRLATFNVENLFTRFLFARGVDQRHAARHGFTVDDLRFRLADPASKALTGQVVSAVDADVLALQEVEGLEVLKRFRDQHLGGREAYPHAIVIDGNDERRIDVGILSRLPLVHLRSWQHLVADGRPVFDRDCLEADVGLPDGRVLTLYVNHFKSMRADGERRPREATAARREQQALAVRKIVEARYGADPDGLFAVLGDFNDRPTDDDEGRSGLHPLLRWDRLHGVIDELPEAERWTHFYKGRGHERGRYQQLDYLLLSAPLRSAVTQVAVERRGLPGRVERVREERFRGVGRDRPKASDHCPLVVDLAL